jgi:hypothetical protein
MMSRTKRNFIIDAVAGLLFFLSLFAGGGAMFHLAVTVLLTAVIMVHLALHWDWVKNQCRRLMPGQAGPASRRAMENLAVDVFLLFTFSIAFVSGAALVVAPGDVEASGAHALSSAMFILGMFVHIALHRTWILGCMRRARHGKSKPAGRASTDGAAATGSGSGAGS